MWAAVAASAAFWALRLFVTAPAVPAQAVTVAGDDLPRGDLSRLFGRAASAPSAPAPAVASRFKLVGVLAPRAERDARIALALISVDEQPAKAYRVGAVVDGDTVLQAVHARGASLGPRGGPGTELELPPPAPAATGVLGAALTSGSLPARQAEALRPPPSIPVPQPPRLLMPQGAPSPPMQTLPELAPEPTAPARIGTAAQQ